MFKRCEECKDGYVYNEDTKECRKCPRETPLEKDGKCLVCPSDTFYEESSGICMKCGKGSLYNSTLSACILVQKPHCPAFATYIPSTQRCQCPSDKPYTDGIECFACETPKFWNTETNKCEQC